MELQKTVGSNIRAIRESKKLTLDAAAHRTGVSRSMLAQIERGDANPTISVLWRIAGGYKVPFTSLLKERGCAPLLIRSGEVRPLAENGGRYVNYPCFPFEEERLFETYRIRVEAGGSLDAQPHLAGAEEYVTVFSGRVEIHADGESFLLEEGDSLRFRADREHSYRNAGGNTALMSMLIYYPEML